MCSGGDIIRACKVRRKKKYPLTAAGPVAAVAPGVEKEGGGVDWSLELDRGCLYSVHIPIRRSRSPHQGVLLPVVPRRRKRHLTCATG